MITKEEVCKIYKPVIGEQYQQLSNSNELKKILIDASEKHDELGTYEKKIVEAVRELSPEYYSDYIQAEDENARHQALKDLLIDIKTTLKNSTSTPIDILNRKLTKCSKNKYCIEDTETFLKNVHGKGWKFSSEVDILAINYTDFEDRGIENQSPIIQGIFSKFKFPR